MKQQYNLKKCLPYKNYLKFFSLSTIIIAFLSLVAVLIVKVAIKIWKLDYRLVMAFILFYLLLVIFYTYLVIFKWKKAKEEIVNENVNHLKKLYYSMSIDEYMPYFINKDIISNKGCLLYSLDGETKEEISFDEVTFQLQCKVVDGFIYLFLVINDENNQNSLSMYELNNEWFNYLGDNNLMKDNENFKLLQEDLTKFVLKILSGRGK